MTRALSRKGFAATLGAIMLLGSPVPLAAQEFRHGLSTFGDLKYPADFKHFDYVNPAAPKGGQFSTYGGAEFLRLLQSVYSEGRLREWTGRPVRYLDGALRR